MRTAKKGDWYIASYGLLISIKGGDEFHHLKELKFRAENDEEAEVEAKIQTEILDLMEKLNPEYSRQVKKKVILTSVRNQSNKRVVYSPGRQE